MPEAARGASAPRTTTPTPKQADSVPTDEHGHEYGSDVERVEHGYAPSLVQGNLQSRESREAAAREEIDTEPITDPADLLATDAEVAARVERARSGRPPAETADTKAVIVNGVAMLLPAGPDADASSIPAEAKAVLENAAQPLRTGQMKGLGNGLRTYDLTRPAATNPSGSPSQAIKAASEATTAEAEADRRTATEGRHVAPATPKA
jgi:hypothetical protein